jgi:hypothetical protein
MPMLVFSVVTPFELAGKYQRFGGTYYYHLHDFNRTINAALLSRRTASTFSTPSEPNIANFLLFEILGFHDSEYEV